MKCKEVLNLLRITRQTLSKYVKLGIIKVKTLPNGYYNYNDEDVYNLISKENVRHNVIYARVSSTCLKKDLETLINTLKTFCNKNGLTISKVYSEICSGLLFDRKSFQELLDDVLDYNKVSKVFVTYKDRLSRISFNMINQLFKKFGTEIIVVNGIDNPKEIEKEIFEEIISLLHCFSMKLYSSRRKEKLKLVEKELILENQINLDK